MHEAVTLCNSTMLTWQMTQPHAQLTTSVANQCSALHCLLETLTSLLSVYAGHVFCCVCSAALRPLTVCKDGWHERSPKVKRLSTDTTHLEDVRRTACMPSALVYVIYVAETLKKCQKSQEYYFLVKWKSDSVLYKGAQTDEELLLRNHPSSLEVQCTNDGLRHADSKQPGLYNQRKESSLSTWRSYGKMRGNRIVAILEVFPCLQNNDMLYFQLWRESEMRSLHVQPKAVKIEELGLQRKHRFAIPFYERTVLTHLN